MTLFSQTSLARSTPDFLISGIECDPGVSPGDWVYIDSLNVAQKALADDLDTANVFGLVEEVSGTTATIRAGGVSKAIFSSLDTTKEYLLSNNIPGGMNPQGVSVPSAPGHVVLVLGKPLNSTQFLVRIGTRMVRS